MKTDRFKRPDDNVVGGLDGPELMTRYLASEYLEVTTPRNPVRKVLRARQAHHQMVRRFDKESVRVSAWLRVMESVTIPLRKDKDPKEKRVSKPLSRLAMDKPSLSKLGLS